MGVRKKRPSQHAFTLIELVVVITIIVILMGLLFPAFKGVQDQAKRAQAKNDLTQIVTAVNAFYTEYGRYPLSGTSEVPLTGNVSVMDVLRNDPTRSAATVTTLNPRGIVFLAPPSVKDPNNPRSGIATQNTTVSGVSVSAGDFVDPFGTAYVLAIDADYSGFTQVGSQLSYTDLTYTKDPPPSGPPAVQSGVIGASYGNDQTRGTKNPASYKFTDSDDIISWQ